MQRGEQNGGRRETEWFRAAELNNAPWNIAMEWRNLLFQSPPSFIHAKMPNSEIILCDMNVSTVNRQLGYFAECQLVKPPFCPRSQILFLITFFFFCCQTTEQA